MYKVTGQLAGQQLQNVLATDPDDLIDLCDLEK
jgi:hypothetical protein